MLLKAVEEGACVGDVGRGVGVENYDVMEVECYAVEFLDNSLITLPNQPGAALLP